MIIMHRFFLGKFRINGFIIVFTFLWSIDVMVNMLGNIPFMISFMISRKQAEGEQYIQYYMYMYMVFFDQSKLIIFMLMWLVAMATNMASYIRG